MGLYFRLLCNFSHSTSHCSYQYIGINYFPYNSCMVQKFILSVPVVFQPPLERYISCCQFFNTSSHFWEHGYTDTYLCCCVCTIKYPVVKSLDQQVSTLNLLMGTSNHYWFIPPSTTVRTLCLHALTWYWISFKAAISPVKSNILF